MPDDGAPKILPLGEDCALVSLGNVISEEVNRRAVAISASIAASPFDGFIECAPAYSSVAVYFEPRKIKGTEATPFENVKRRLSKVVNGAGPVPETGSRAHEIPVIFGGDDGPDLEEVADRAGIDEGELIRIFLERSYRVYMIGFLPGFPYLGTVDDRIAVSRRDTPRTRVPAGSVGIAGRQTGIYPFDSPGGWQIIGRTPLTIFDTGSDRPAMFRAGDSVRFVPET